MGPPELPPSPREARACYGAATGNKLPSPVVAASKRPLPLPSRNTPASASPAELAPVSSGVSPPEEIPELKGRWGMGLKSLLEAGFPEKGGAEVSQRWLF